MGKIVMIVGISAVVDGSVIGRLRVVEVCCDGRTDLAVEREDGTDVLGEVRWSRVVVINDVGGRNTSVTCVSGLHLRHELSLLAHLGVALLSGWYRGTLLPKYGDKVLKI